MRVVLTVARRGRMAGGLGVPRRALFFFFKDPAPPEISPLPLPDALPIWAGGTATAAGLFVAQNGLTPGAVVAATEGLTPNPLPNNYSTTYQFGAAYLGFGDISRSEQHTSELQSQSNFLCRLLLDKQHSLT